MPIIQAIKEAISLILQVVQGVKALAAFIEANKTEAWFQDSAKTFSELRNTVNDQKLSPEERTARLREAGRNIRDLIGKL